MKCNSCISKVLSAGTLTGMVAFFMLFAGNPAYATGPEISVQAQQTKRITGTVMDENGEPVIGATVTQEGTSNGTVTDVSGAFSLNVSPGAKIKVSFIGYSTQEIVVGTSDRINVTLTEDSQSLDELVVVGYGTMRKRDVTGSISQTKGEDIMKTQTFSALDGLRGKAAGVNIFSNSGQPGAYASTVVIRGISTINSSSDPLYVVDGVVIEDFNMVNPNDIETIEVLKDASAAAIYGARGANGVILVTTKRGSSNKEGSTISYQGSVSVSTVARFMNLLNANQWCDAFMKGLENENNIYGKSWSLNRKDYFNDNRYFDSNGYPIYDTDWQREATRTAVSHNHQLNIQSKGKTSSTGAFINFTNNQGIMLSTYNKRLNGKIAYDANPTKWLSTSLNLMVNHTWGRYTPETGGDQIARRTMIEMLPWMPVTNPDGSYTMASNAAAVPNTGFESMANPVALLKMQERLFYNTKIFGNAALTFHLMEGLDLKTQFGIDDNLRMYKGYSSVLLENQSKPDGFAERNHRNSFYWQEETYLTYNKLINEDNRLNVMLGMSWQERNSEYDRMNARGFNGDDFFKYNNMGVGTNRPGITSDSYSWRMNSYFLRAAYTLMNKYSFTATGRYDGSSKFGKNHKYAFFPSAGVAWNIKEENFMKDVNAIDDLRLHTSYGITGNSEIGSFNSLLRSSSGTFLLDGNAVPYNYVSSIANPDLKWEKTAQWDLGFNLGVLNNRLRFDISYYYKKTTDLLLDCPIPTQVGFGSIYKNIGSVRNTGLDIMINANPIKTADFSWDINFNANYNKNKVLKLGENDADIEQWGWVGGSESIIRVGESLGSFYGYTRYGIWDGNKTPMCDQGLCDGNHTIGRPHRSKTKSIIGKGIPDWTGSFINTFKYKNFDLTVDLQFVAGVETMRQYYHSTYDRFGLTNGLEKILTDAWTPNNKNTMQQAIFISGGTGHAGQDTTVDSQWICNGSYLRANLIQLGYTFDKTVCKSIGINALRAYLSVNNAFLICDKDFDGYDPEATSNRSDGSARGTMGQNMAFFSYPRARTFTLGVNVTF